MNSPQATRINCPCPTPLLGRSPTSVASATADCRKYRKGGFNFAQGVLPLLLQAEGLQYPPTLIFTGATASLKGSAHFSQFATGKFALRALAQSLAREFGPRGVHVSHAIIDGVIDVPHAKAWTFEQEDAKLDPDAVCCSQHVSSQLRWRGSVFVLICNRLLIPIGTYTRNRAQPSHSRST